jgi:hypothetical protein
MQKWETHWNWQRGPDVGKTMSVAMQQADEFGAQGWELVSVAVTREHANTMAETNLVACFYKRPKPS